MGVHRLQPAARRALLSLTGLTVALGVAVTGSPAPAHAAPDVGLTRKLNAVLSDSRTSAARTGAVVLDARSGERLYSRYGTRSVLPASNTKVLTGAAALETLGVDYRFKTEVIRRGPVVGGTLQGRLYLKGYGDPTARQSDYARLAAGVRAAGISRVSGDLVADATFFDDQRYNPGWSTGYADAYYAAEISGLSIAPNGDYDTGTVILNYRPASRKGGRAVITTTPSAARSYIRLVNATTTSSRGTATTFWANRAHGSNTITVGGRVPLGRSAGHRLITVHDPARYAAAVFRAELVKAGVRVAGSTIRRATPAGKQHVLARDTSMRLADLMLPYLKLSNNMHAEALTKTMGRVQGRPGTWSDGLAVTVGYLRRVGVPMGGVGLVDGSGLTRGNRVTPLAMATLLQKVRSEPWFGVFYRSLPVAGNTDRMVGGTLRYRMNGTAAANNARAKTGTLTGVTALSGYVRGADGRRYVYSMISNYARATPRPVENSFVIALARWSG